MNITKDIKTEKRVYYSDRIDLNDHWNEPVYSKRLQKGLDLGDRMQNAFLEGFQDGFTNIVLIGSDLYDLSQSDLENAFEELRKKDLVIGPANDGGYYLIGMKNNNPGIFENKKWGSSAVLKDTLDDLKGKSVSLLAEKNDVDHYEDLAQFEILKKLL